MTRLQVLQSREFALLMSLPNNARVNRLLQALAEDVTLFDGWDILSMEISDAAANSLPGGGTILLNAQINNAPDAGDVHQQAFYLKVSD